MQEWGEVMLSWLDWKWFKYLTEQGTEWGESWNEKEFLSSLLKQGGFDEWYIVTNFIKLNLDMMALGREKKGYYGN